GARERGGGLGGGRGGAAPRRAAAAQAARLLTLREGSRAAGGPLPEPIPRVRKPRLEIGTWIVGQPEPRLGDVGAVPADLAGAAGFVSDRHVEPRDPDHQRGERPDLGLATGCDVEHLAGTVARGGGEHGAAEILHVEEVAGLAAVAEDEEWLAGEDALEEGSHHAALPV